jgi:hypothetical protein
VLANVEVEAVYLGSDWRTSSGLIGLPGLLDGFLQSVTNSSYLGALGQAGYGVGRGSFTGATIDPTPLFGDVGDWQIQAEIAADISNGSIPAPDGNRLYVIFLEPGVSVSSPFGDSSVDLLGYHSDFLGPTGRGVSYAVLPFPGGPNGAVTGLNFFESLTAVTSHELAESVTDPQGVNVGRSAWFDATWRDPQTGQRGAEIADMTQNVFINLNGYVVQAAVNRQRHLLIPAGGTFDPRSSGLPHHARAAKRHAHARHADGPVPHRDPLEVGQLFP